MARVRWRSVRATVGVLLLLLLVGAVVYGVVHTLGEGGRSGQESAAQAVGASQVLLRVSED